MILITCKLNIYWSAKFLSEKSTVKEERHVELYWQSFHLCKFIPLKANFKQKTMKNAAVKRLKGTGRGVETFCEIWFPCLVSVSLFFFFLEYRYKAYIKIYFFVFILILAPKYIVFLESDRLGWRRRQCVSSPIQQRMSPEIENEKMALSCKVARKYCLSEYKSIWHLPMEWDVNWVSCDFNTRITN